MRDACRDRYLARNLRVHRGGRNALGRSGHARWQALDERERGVSGDEPVEELPGGEVDHMERGGGLLTLEHRRRVRRTRLHVGAVHHVWPCSVPGVSAAMSIE